MTRILDLPWRAAPQGVVATILAPGAGAVAITAEGWADATAAHLLPDRRAFVALPGAAFLAVETVPGVSITIAAPAAPHRARAVFQPRFAASPALALLAPRAIRAPLRRPAYALAAGQARIDAALAAQALDTALGVAAEMLLAARDAPETHQAVAALLVHCARHPLARSPALGAFVAALTE
ncbi:hypothetical protein KPL78_12200 [Roseomonas sp. HJA6]|uniref:AraC family transcriptional regulator n=1 Tax=Roseomonas alba TaxID=2846776 RepID=A0ABS7A8K2_9PROT|nr:hypothetical protein [Neoroseomonas alba]MBW6398617.1 hypothetical protein [Neoroseomonas alba]